MLNKKTLPFPISLSALIVPFINSMNFLTILNPSPVPPYFLEVSEPDWINGSKIDLSLSWGIPIPESFISKNKLLSAELIFSCFIEILISPLSGVNFKLLLIKFNSIWDILTGSPMKTVSSDTMLFILISMFLDSVFCLKFSITCLMISFMLISISSSIILPESIFEISNLSFIKTSNISLERLMIFNWDNSSC